MNYSLIDTSHIFIYKALPAEMSKRIVRLPSSVKVTLPEQTGLSQIENYIQKESLQLVNWSDLAERNLTHSSLIDAFAALVHIHGYKRVHFYSKALGISLGITALSSTVKVLTGIYASDFIIQYTLQMIRDLEHRTNLLQKEIAELLHFTTQQSYSQFLRNYKHKY